MTWDEVAGRLAAARSYWVGSTTASGAPHAAPVWGAVPARPRPRLRRGVRGQAAVGDGVAAGRLRRLAAPLDGFIV